MAAVAAAAAAAVEEEESCSGRGSEVVTMREGCWVKVDAQQSRAGLPRRTCARTLVKRLAPIPFNGMDSYDEGISRVGLSLFLSFRLDVSVVGRLAFNWRVVETKVSVLKPPVHNRVDCNVICTHL